MKASERNLLIVTSVAAVIYVGTMFWPGGSTSDSSASAPNGDLAEIRSTFRNYADTLRNGKKISDDYAQVAMNAPVGGDPSATNSFSDELYQLLRRLQFNTPNLDPAKYAEIENISDYCTVDIHGTVTSSLSHLLQLLVDMENKGMLIKSFKLNRQSTRDASEIQLDFNVARVVKQDADSRRRLNPGRYYDK